MSRVEARFSATRNMVEISRIVGKELNSKGFLMNTEVIRIRMAKVIENESARSSSHGGSGRSSTTRIARMPIASAISPFLR